MAAPEKSLKPWWKQTTVYQIYPRSYCDSNKDGIGDIPGIISKLDYINDVGFETIWFSPFFSSPQKDFGYDVSNYFDIAPEYGIFDDCLRLIDEVHKRDMKVLFDLAVNHTSDQHPWFVESRSSRDNPKRDWYLWRDGKRPDGKAPPNNWKSKVSGSGWHYDTHTGQWYWAAFLPFQPDLNFRNPDVKRAVLNIVRFWLDKGVDGFRLDILGSLFEDEQFRDNPFIWKLLPSPDSPDMLFQTKRMTENHPDTFAFVRELRKVVDAYDDPPRFMVGEVFGSLDELKRFCGENEHNSGLHSVFLFQTMKTPLQTPKLRKLIADFEGKFREPFTPTWVYGNHDSTRRLSVLKRDVKKFKLNVMLQFTARGIPFTYYGEEIGMIQADIPVNDALDPVARYFDKLPRFIQNALQKISFGGIARDGCRTPMQWDNSDCGGFTGAAAASWLPVNDNVSSCNVQFQQKDPDSLLSFYKKILHLRSSFSNLNGGPFSLIPGRMLPRTVLGYTRGAVAVYLNFGEWVRSVELSQPGWDLLLSTHPSSSAPTTDTLYLKPWEGVILKQEG